MVRETVRQKSYDFVEDGGLSFMNEEITEGFFVPSYIS